MPTHHYKIEAFVDVEYEYVPGVRGTFTTQGYSAHVVILGPSWLFTLPDGAFDDMKEHILEGELAGPDPDKENDRRRDNEV